jgi:maltose alpha-D-glucosyltransferase/alpha-amylase
MNPDLEVCRHLTERAGFTATPGLAGAIEYRVGEEGGEEPRTLAMLQLFVPNQGDAWTYALDQVGIFLERALALEEGPRKRLLEFAPPPILDAIRAAPPKQCTELLGDFALAAELLGRRTFEMHAALAADHGDPSFIPEPHTQLYQRSLAQSMRNTVRRTVQLLRKKLDQLPEQARRDADELVKREADAVAFFRNLGAIPLTTLRIRCHGDYHLGQVLWTGKDFIIIDFEGEPHRSLGERRLKRSPLRDVAGMIRSFQYAAATGQRRHMARGGADSSAVQQVAAIWERAAAGTFLRAYLEAARAAPTHLVPESEGAVTALLRLWLFEKALYEISYELNSRPDWAEIPLRAALALLSTGA